MSSIFKTKSAYESNVFLPENESLSLCPEFTSLPFLSEESISS